VQELTEQDEGVYIYKNIPSSSDILPVLELLLSEVCSGVKMSAIVALESHISSRQFYTEELQIPVQSDATSKRAKTESGPAAV
jgi:hypothetical protein